jgi:hypothetical protein
MTAAKRRFLACVLGPAAALVAVWLLLAVTASASPPGPIAQPVDIRPLTAITGQPVLTDTDKIDLFKTVSVGSQCPTALTTTSVTVIVGTPVRYCYTMYNHTSVILTRHNVVDSQLGVLLNDREYEVKTGEGLQFSVVFTPSASVTNTATWTSYNPGPTDVVSDTKTATVTVLFPRAYLPLIQN